MSSTRVAEAVYRRPSGTLMISWYQGGRRRREHLPKGASITDANNLRKQRIGEGVTAGLAKLPGRCRFEDLVSLLKAEHELKRRRKPLNLKQITAAFAGWKAHEITTEALERYVADRRKVGAADNTIKNHLATLRHAFHLARKRGYDVQVPAFPMPADTATVECYFTRTELDRLVALLPEVLRPAVEFAALTGLRKGNVAQLTWPEVKFDRREIVLSGVVMKNGDPLTIPFTAPIERILRAQLSRRGRRPTVFELPDDLLRHAWARAVGTQGLDKWGRKFDSRVGGFVKVRPRFHDLRHTFAQHMIDNGVDEAKVMRLGAWKTRSTFERYKIESTEALRAALKQRDAGHAAERKAARKQTRVVQLLRTA